MEGKDTAMKTKQMIRITAVLSAAAFLGQTRLLAQSWTTVIDYQLAAGKSTDGLGLAVDSLGDVFSSGYGYDAAGATHGLVLATDSTESTWLLSDDTNPSSSQDNSVVFGVAVDPQANVYSAGWLTPPCSSRKSCPGQYWYVRKSSNAGQTWSTVDLFQYAAGQTAVAYGSASDNSGNLFVAGLANDAKRVGHWVVRRTANGGANWVVVDDLPWATPSQMSVMSFVPTVGTFAVGSLYVNGVNVWLARRTLDGGQTWASADTYQLISGQEAYARGVSSDSQGNIYVVGYAHNASGIAVWIVRGSGDGGATWTTVDTFSYVAAKASVAHAIGTDSLGRVVVAGAVQDAQGTSHWLVRRPVTGGGWQTVEDYQLAPGQTSDARAIVTDAAGNILVAGIGVDATGSHWIVRKANP
jgi:hypothetical protein